MKEACGRFDASIWPSSAWCTQDVQWVGLADEFKEDVQVLAGPEGSLFILADSNAYGKQKKIMLEDGRWYLLLLEGHIGGQGRQRWWLLSSIYGIIASESNAPLCLTLLSATSSLEAPWIATSLVTHAVHQSLLCWSYYCQGVVGAGEQSRAVEVPLSLKSGDQPKLVRLMLVVEFAVELWICGCSSRTQITIILVASFQTLVDLTLHSTSPRFFHRLSCHVPPPWTALNWKFVWFTERGRIQNGHFLLPHRNKLSDRQFMHKLLLNDISRGHGSSLPIVYWILAWILCHTRVMIHFGTICTKR